MSGSSISKEQLLVFAYLKLVADGDLPAVGLPEMARFALRRKQTVRFFCSESADRVERALSGFVPHFARKPVLTRYVGGSWSCVESSAGLSIDITTAAGEIIALGRDSGLVGEVLDAEIENAEEAGALFGYPACCIAAVGGLAQAGAAWPAELVRRSPEVGGTAKANRLPVDWGGLSPVGELFPCSLACPMAAAIGFDGYDSLQRLGLNSLADCLIHHAESAFHIDEKGRARPSQAGVPGATQFAW